MFRPYKPYIPQDFSELCDLIGSMMINWPKFIDTTGYFPGRNIDTTFYELGEGLRIIRAEIGDELYFKLKRMAEQMRPHFDADPEKKTGKALKGQKILSEMQDLLMRVGQMRAETIGSLNAAPTDQSANPMTKASAVLRRTISSTASRPMI